MARWFMAWPKSLWFAVLASVSLLVYAGDCLLATAPTPEFTERNARAKVEATKPGIGTATPNGETLAGETLGERLKHIDAALALLGREQQQLQQHVIQQGNWIGQLLHRTKDQADRVRWESEARLLAPEFSPLELGLLDRWELNTDPLTERPKAVAFNEAGAPHMQRERSQASSDAFHRYTAWGMIPNDSNTGKSLYLRAPPVAVDPTLPMLRIDIDAAETAHPVILARNDPDHPSSPASDADIFYEIDTSPLFDSPHLWRYPQLVPAAAVTDAPTQIMNPTSTQGQSFYLFMTSLRDYAPTRALRFPFRVSAMGYPLARDKISFADFAKFAKALQKGLSNADAISEVYAYARVKFVWGGNTLEQEPIDSFRSGIAGCGILNDLMGAMLELNGLRYRLVGGFHPIFRTWFPGGGHSAIEVHDGHKWSYIDSFLDVYTPGVDAGAMRSLPIGKQTVAHVDTTDIVDPTGQFKQHFGAGLTIADLFKYRTYGDKAQRLPSAHMLRLLAASGARNRSAPSIGTYGLDWPLRTTSIHFDPAVDLPPVTTIHVRARYIKSQCRIHSYQDNIRCSDAGAVASEWTTTSFSIKPGDALLADQRTRGAHPRAAIAP